MSKPLSAEYLASLEEALDTMNTFLDEIRTARSYLTPSLYGPLSYGYRTYVTDGEHFVLMDVVNDGTRLSTWVPTVGGPLGDGWRYEVTHWADPDDVTVHHVERYELEHIVQLRELVESDALTLEGALEVLTTEDVETIRAGMQSTFAAMEALNDVHPSIVSGGDHAHEVERYLDDNWSSEGARAFRQSVAAMHDSFHDLQTGTEKLIAGQEGLMMTFMGFVTAIVELLDLRRENAEDLLSNVVGGGISLVGVAVSPASALSWVSLAYSVVDSAGGGDSDDRRQSMDEFQQHAITRAVSEAVDASTVSWPSFATPGYDFEDS